MQYIRTAKDVLQVIINLSRRYNNRVPISSICNQLAISPELLSSFLRILQLSDIISFSEDKDAVILNNQK